MIEFCDSEGVVGDFLDSLVTANRGDAKEVDTLAVTSESDDTSFERVDVRGA